MYKAIIFFPNGSSAGLDTIVPLVFKDLISKSNGNARLILIKSLNKLLNLLLGEGKVPEKLRLFFFGAKLIALVKIDGDLRSIAIGNTLRRIASKCSGSKDLAERQNFLEVLEQYMVLNEELKLLHTPLVFDRIC